MSESNLALGMLQKFVDGFTMDVGRLRAALDDESTPDSARVLLVGALNYLLDRLDVLPDDAKGLGFADDAMVLRVAAAQAVAEGASSRALVQLAKETGEVRELLGELDEPFARMVSRLSERVVRGRDAHAILRDRNQRAIFEADVTRALQKVKVEPIDPSWMGAVGLIDEMRRMVRHSLKRMGLLA